MTDVRHELTGPDIRVEIDAATGTVASLRYADGFEYARRGRRGLGDWRVAFRVPGDPWRDSASHEAPCHVAFTDGVVSADRSVDGVLAVRVRHRIDTSPNASYVIEWEIENASRASSSLASAPASSIEVGDFALPFPVNDDLRDGPLERRVFLHPFVAGHGSYFRVARGHGDGPDLLVLTGPGTAPEEFARSADPDESPAGREFPGVSEIYLLSAASRERSWPSDGPNGHRSLRLEPGERRAFSLHFLFASGDAEKEKALLRNGKLSIRVVPGLVLPNDLDLKLRVATDVPIRAMETLDGGTTIDTVGKREKGQIFRVRAGGVGRRRIRIHYGKDEWTQVTILATEPLRDLLSARARFVAERQRCLDPDDPLARRDAFLPFDSARGEIHVNDERSTLVDGRGVVGTAEPLFLAMKSIVAPEPHEIDAVAEFVRAHLAPSVDSGRLAAEWSGSADRAAEILRALLDVKHATGLPTSIDAARLEALAASSANVASSETRSGSAGAPYDPESDRQGDAAAVRASRSEAPTFERFGCDRWWWDDPASGSRRESDELGLSRSSPIGSAVLLAAAPRAPADRTLDLAYGGLLAPFGNVEESGVAHAGFRSEPARRGFEPLSGDVALGLIGSMRSLASIAVDDPEYGPIGYGCVLERRFDDWRVIPRDGLQKTVLIHPIDLRVRITNGDLVEVLASESRTRLALTFANESEFIDRTRLEIFGLADGEYDVATPESPTETAKVSAGALIFPEFALPLGRRRYEFVRRP